MCISGRVLAARAAATHIELITHLLALWLSNGGFAFWLSPIPFISNKDHFWHWTIQLLVVHSISVSSGICTNQFAGQTSAKRRKVSSVFLMTPGSSVIKYWIFTPLLDTFPSLLSSDFPFLRLLKVSLKVLQEIRRQKISYVFFKNSFNLATFGTLLLS